MRDCYYVLPARNRSFLDYLEEEVKTMRGKGIASRKKSSI